MLLYLLVYVFNIRDRVYGLNYVDCSLETQNSADYKFDIFSANTFYFKGDDMPGLQYYTSSIPVYSSLNPFTSDKIKYLDRENYYFNFEGYENGDDYLFGFFDVERCDLVVFTNQNSDYFEHDVYEWQNPCIFHFHKYSNYTISYKTQSYAQRMRKIKTMIINFKATNFSQSNHSTLRGAINYFNNDSVFEVQGNLFFATLVLAFIGFLVFIVSFCATVILASINGKYENNYIDANKNRWLGMESSEI